jgi:Kdo2-lipid IVA lauroyltransferase/acyltransferase
VETGWKRPGFFYTMGSMAKIAGFIAWIQYAGFRVAAALFAIFPIEWNLRTARWIGTLWWRFDERHRLMAADHLRTAYASTLSEAEVERIVRASFQHFVMLAIEFMQAPRLLNEGTWSRFVKLIEFEPTLRLLLREKSVIFLTGHFGNWELMGQVLSLLCMDITAVMRPLNNDYLNRYIVAIRARRGLRLLTKKEVAAESQEILDQGGALAFIADQDAGRKGMFVPFFGRPASTYKSIGLLAMSAECPIVVGYCRRIGTEFRYEVGVQGTLMPSDWSEQPDPLRWITERYTALLEQAIRSSPEQYLWHHRRWKTKPGDTIRKRRLPESPSASLALG